MADRVVGGGPSPREMTEAEFDAALTRAFQDSAESALHRYALFGGERWVANGGWLDFIRSAETLEEALPRTEEAVWWEVFDLRRGKAVATSIARREEHLRERGLWAGEEGQRDDPGRG
jgi:hypothetical protein